jgi:hypothetical protein
VTMTVDQILGELRRAFPAPDYSVGSWDYGRRFRIGRVRDGRRTTGFFDKVGDSQNLKTAIANARSAFA